MTHRDRPCGPPGRKERAGDAGHRQALLTRMGDRNGAQPRLSGSVAHALRCPASLRRTLLAENLARPSLSIMITDPWY
ncbi:MAG: hypothetical protein VB959_05385 [Rhodospirillales bacterium]